jgi:drug/metabolite transporter (DMT)-like permease
MKHLPRPTFAHILAIGPLLIFIAAVLWGLDGVLRRSLYTLAPSVIVFYEHLVGAVILAPFVYKLWHSEGGAMSMQRKEWVAVGVVALLSGLLGTLFFTSALASVGYISFSVVYLVQKLQPLFVVGAASVLLRETPSRHFFMWGGLALVAGYFVTFPYGIVNFGAVNPGEIGAAHLYAALLALGAAVCWGTSTAISRYALLHHNTTFITGLRFLLTVPLALVAVLMLTDLSAAVNPLVLSLPQLGSLVLIACSTGMFALWVYYKGLQQTPAHISAIVELAFPLTAVGVDYFLYNTILTVPQLLAGAVLLFAAYKVAQSSK